MTVKERLLQAIDRSSETNLAQTLTFLQTLNQNTPMTSGRSETIEDEEPYDTPIEEIREGIYIGFQQALSGNGNPVSRLWDGMDVD